MTLEIVGGGGGPFVGRFEESGGQYFMMRWASGT